MTDLQNSSDPDARLAFEPRVRAFAVGHKGLMDHGIYFATSASKAKLAALLQGREAGYRLRFAQLQVRRAPRYDGATYCGCTPTVGVVPECLVLASEP